MVEKWEKLVRKSDDQTIYVLFDRELAVRVEKIGIVADCWKYTCLEWKKRRWLNLKNAKSITYCSLKVAQAAAKQALIDQREIRIQQSFLKW